MGGADQEGSMYLVGLPKTCLVQPRMEGERIPSILFSPLFLFPLPSFSLSLSLSILPLVLYLSPPSPVLPLLSILFSTSQPSRLAPHHSCTPIPFSWHASLTSSLSWAEPGVCRNSPSTHCTAWPDRSNSSR